MRTYKLLFLCLLVSGCMKPEHEPNLIDTKDVEISSSVPSLVTFNGVLFQIPSNLTDYGFVYGKLSFPTIEKDSVVSLGTPDSTGRFSREIKNFERGYNYSVRVYLKTDQKVMYGENIMFNITQIKKVIPVQAVRGDTITLYGANFTLKLEECIVRIGAKTAKVLSVNQTSEGFEMKIIVPLDVSYGHSPISIEINGVKSEYSDYRILQMIPIPNYPGVTFINAVTFTIGEVFYVGSGYDTTGNYSRDFYSYDLNKNFWTRIADIPEGRSGAVAFTIGNKAYVGLGAKGGVSASTDFFVYDPLVNKWASIASFLGVGRKDAVAFSLANEGYVATGNTGGKEDSNGSYLKDIYKYNPLTNEWKSLNNFSGQGNEELGAFVIGEKAYLAELAMHTHNLKHVDIWEYNSYTDQWLNVFSMYATENNYKSINAFTIDGTGVIIGGLNSRIEFKPEFAHDWKMICCGDYIVDKCVTASNGKIALIGVPHSENKSFSNRFWKFSIY